MEHGAAPQDDGSQGVPDPAAGVKEGTTGHASGGRIFSISATCNVGSPGPGAPLPATHTPQAVPQPGPFIQAELRALLAAERTTQVTPAPRMRLRAPSLGCQQ